eukprot:383896-Rhodomonas_salina.1
MHCDLKIPGGVLSTICTVTTEPEYDLERVGRPRTKDNKSAERTQAERSSADSSARQDRVRRDTWRQDVACATLRCDLAVCVPVLTESDAPLCCPSLHSRCLSNR